MVAVTSTGWLLSLHMLAAFALVGSLTAFLIVWAAGRRVDDADRAVALSRISGPATIVLRAGLGLTAALGVWLVFAVDGYSLIDGWIIATIVLWLVMGALGGRLVVEQRKMKALTTSLTASGEEGRSAELQAALRRPAALTLRAAAAASGVAALALMIWKPGAG